MKAVGNIKSFYRAVTRHWGQLQSRRLVAASLIVLSAGVTLGQEPFVAIPAAEAPRYHIDFARHFFTSPEAEKRDRTNLDAIVKELETLKGRVGNSAQNLDRALKLNDRVQVQLNKHYSYLYLRAAVNTLDETSLAEGSALYADVSARSAFLSTELMQLDDRALTALVARKQSIKSYLFAIESARRNRPYKLSLKEEEVLSATAPDNYW